MFSLNEYLDEILSRYYHFKIKKLKNLPSHVAIIMDGNGRWAKKRGLPRTAGHRAATRSIRKIIEASLQSKIRYLSLFAFSTENWKRPKEEVDSILKLIEEQLKENLEELNSNGVKIKLVGSRRNLPEFLIKSFEEAEKKTSKNDRLTLYMLINYSGRREILEAVEKIIENPDSFEAKEEKFRELLYEPEMPDPDLIIRTSGEIRISNFYLWQSAYSELYFTKTLFPDFKKSEFFKALMDYSRRKRRFGGLAEF
ncbi:MAG: polyprenyl diphosphate synthase [Actinobacteria bacterium]|nr:polyprenyl diphosphate synthase [Actinomycetota bacterium]